MHGTGFEGKEPYPLTDKHSDIVIDNINNNCLEFSGVKIPVIFGITERFQESIDLFAKIAGWKTTAYVEKSKGRAFTGKRKYLASDELVKKISEYNQLDMKIYNTAKIIFDKQLDFFKGSSE